MKRAAGEVGWNQYNHHFLLVSFHGMSNPRRGPVNQSPLGTVQGRPPAPGLGGPMQPPDLHVSFHGLSNPRRGPPTPGLGGPGTTPLLAPFISWIEQSTAGTAGSRGWGRIEPGSLRGWAVQCKPRDRISGSNGDTRFRHSNHRVRKVPDPPDQWTLRDHRRS